MSETNKIIAKELKKASSSFRVELLGGRIEQLIMHGTQILSSSPRGDGKTGSTHPCSPIFGPETTTTYGLPQHGPVRNTPLHLEAEDDHSITINCQIEEGTYPKGIQLTQKISLTPDVFVIKTAHTNHSTKSIPVNFGEHCYWHTPQGWEGLKVNGKDVTALVKTTGVISLAEQNTIQIPGKPLIHLEQKGLHFAVLWSYKNAASDSFDTEYVCIEPVEGNPMKNYFGSHASLIEPHTERLTMLRISLT